jgi:hypothetical protein
LRGKEGRRGKIELWGGGGRNNRGVGEDGMKGDGGKVMEIEEMERGEWEK